MSKLKVRAYKPTFVRVSNRQLEAIGEGIRASGDEAGNAHPIVPRSALPLGPLT